jgi:hypothetical protein
MRARIFIATFFILTLLPGIQMLTGAIPSTTVNENRRLAPAPTLSTPMDRLPRAANEWFGDHFGLRSLLIKLKMQIDYSLFRTSDRVLVGRDGWLFYRDTVNVGVPHIEAMLAEGKGAAIVQGVKMFTEALERAGIRTVLVINMMSDRFYGDMLPASAARRPAHPRIDDLVAELRALPSVRYVDSLAILTRTMAERQIFHKTDFHWNDPAAFEVAKAVADTISDEEGLPQSVWTHPLKITKERVSGGIATFMPLFVPPSEDVLMVNPTFSWPPGLKVTNGVGVFETVTTSTPDAVGFLPPALFIGDSFLDGMFRAGLQSRFVSTARARWTAGLKLSQVAQEIPPNTRWCVVEFIEVEVTAIAAFSDLDDVAKAVAIIDHRGG